MANQLDGKIFDNPALMPSKTAYSDFVQTKARPSAIDPSLMQWDLILRRNMRSRRSANRRVLPTLVGN